MTAAGNDRSGTFRTLKTIFLVEAERYDDARRHLFGAGAPAFREDELYALLVHLGRMPLARGDGRFASLRDDLMQRFLERFGSSVFAPHVRLMAAESKREAARSASGPARERLLEEALALATRVKRSGLGAPYFDRAAILKARVYFEDLHRPGGGARGARRTSGGGTSPGGWRRRSFACASFSRRGTGTTPPPGSSRLAADADTSVALLGRYGLGRLAFLAGQIRGIGEDALGSRREASVEPMGERRPRARDGREGGDAGRARRARPVPRRRARALARRVRGGARLPRRAREAFPRIEPRAAGDIHEGGDRGGVRRARGRRGRIRRRLDAARADFTRLVESYPLHELAPRALERLAELAAREDPAEALSQYGTLMERYPEYPFMERVRERYVALGKSAGPPAPKKGSK